MDEIQSLLQSDEPLICLGVRRRLLDEDQRSPAVVALEKAARNSPLTGELLAEREGCGEIPYHPYRKWVGAHWVLACLADLGYPSGDASLLPLLEQDYAWLFSEHHQRSIKTIQGRVRRCASQEGNALFAALSLGMVDDRAQLLAENLVNWQWADGGWNCDKNPEARQASFMESLIPLRALNLYARVTGEAHVRAAVERAAEVFLKRQLFKRQSNGQVIAQDFTRLHYPCYWHYDILFGLKVIAEAGFIQDPRCRPALDLLLSKRLPQGGFPAESRYYRTSEKTKSGRSRVDWGSYTLPGNKRANQFVTLDALVVLKETGWEGKVS